jgi:hypothetical protein
MWSAEPESGRAPMTWGKNWVSLRYKRAESDCPGRTTSKGSALSDIRDSVLRVLTNAIRTAFRFVLALFSNHCPCILATSIENSASGYTVLKGIIMMVDGFKICQTCLGIHWSVIGCTTMFSHSCSRPFTYQPEPWTSD